MNGNLVSAKASKEKFEEVAITLQNKLTYGFYSKAVFKQSSHGDEKLLIWGWLYTVYTRYKLFDKIPILSKAINLTSPMKYDIIDLSRFKKGKIFNG